MKTKGAKSYDELYAELRPKNLNLDQYDMHELVGKAYADQQVKAERRKILQDAIDSVIAMRDRSFNEDYIDAYELVINQLKSLKIKQP